LQRLVDQGLGTANRRIPGASYGREEFGGVGIAADIVAAVSFGERTARIQRSRLDPGESGGVTCTRRGNRDFAFDQLVGDDAPQADLECAVISRETLGAEQLAALAIIIDAVADIGGIVELALDDLDIAEALDRSGLRDRAGRPLPARVAEPRRGIVASKRVEHANRKDGVAASHRVADVEHSGERRIPRYRLCRAEGRAAASDPEAVADAQRRCRSRRRQSNRKSQSSQDSSCLAHWILHLVRPVWAVAAAGDWLVDDRVELHWSCFNWIGLMPRRLGSPLPSSSLSSVSSAGATH
jgi:hypothetical protein